LTFDQYLAQQKEKDAAIPKLEGVRKANEGADDIWKGAVPLTKNEEEGTYYVGKVLAQYSFPTQRPHLSSYQTKQTAKSRPKKEEKVYIEIDAHFERPDRGGRGRGRGDRGGDRGRGDRGVDRTRGGRGRGGGGGRGGRPHNDTSTINVDSQNDFPSLS
jgi:plasminogen activator inhibitor 1 RNA-binding protein